MHYFLKFIFGIKFYMFRTVPLSIIRSFFTVHSNDMSHRFADSQRAGSGWIHLDPAGNLSIELYDIYHCRVCSEKLLMMDKGTVRNIQSFIPKNKFEKLVHLVGFIIRIYHDARPPERQHCYFKCITFEHSPPLRSVYLFQVFTKA